MKSLLLFVAIAIIAIVALGDRSPKTNSEEIASVRETREIRGRARKSKGNDKKSGQTSKRQKKRRGSKKNGIKKSKRKNLKRTRFNKKKNNKQNKSGNNFQRADCDKSKVKDVFKKFERATNAERQAKKAPKLYKQIAKKSSFLCFNARTCAEHSIDDAER